MIRFRWLVRLLFDLAETPVDCASRIKQLTGTKDDQNDHESSN
ncbi:MAG TPA: hypothetical protein VFS96_04235 [Nitrolancea sp.]|nr:hypothetical protein [Nitrolancea sp.]